MQFLKTLVLIMIAVVFIVFAYNNWQAVTVDLWGGLELVTKLPVLLLLTFLAGVLPIWAYHRTVVWRLRRRLVTLEANQARTASAAAVVAPARRRHQNLQTSLSRNRRCVRSEGL